MKESALFFAHATATSHVELTSCLLSFVFVLKTQQQVKSTQFKAKTWWRLESVGHSYRWSPPSAGKEQRLSVLLFSIFFRFTFFFNRNKFESFVRCFGRFINSHHRISTPLAIVWEKKEDHEKELPHIKYQSIQWNLI